MYKILTNFFLNVKAVEKKTYRVKLELAGIEPGTSEFFVQHPILTIDPWEDKRIIKLGCLQGFSISVVR